VNSTHSFRFTQGDYWNSPSRVQRFVTTIYPEWQRRQNWAFMCAAYEMTVGQSRKMESLFAWHRVMCLATALGAFVPPKRFTPLKSFLGGAK
jgi:hypothetical protein